MTIPSTLSRQDIAALIDQYRSLPAGDLGRETLEREWRRRAPKAKSLAEVAVITAKSPDPLGYWESLMRENGYTRHGYPFQRQKSVEGFSPSPDIKN